MANKFLIHAKQRFDSVLNGLSALGIEYKENDRLVRGLVRHYVG